MADDDRNALIRQLRKSGATLQQLADRFAISIQRAGRIATDKKRGHGIPCPECGGDSRTLRTAYREAYVARRHECRTCCHRWRSEQRNV
jgi:hypothetical protein